MAVHQLLPSFSPADLISEFALELRRRVRSWGVDGQVHAEESERGFESVASAIRPLKAEPKDWVLYHQYRTSRASNQLLHTRARRALLAHPLRDSADRPAHAERAALARHVELALAFDAKTEANLKALGYARVERVAPFVDLERYQLTSRPRGLRVAAGLTTGDRTAEWNALADELRLLDPRAKVSALSNLRRERLRQLQGSAVFVSLEEEAASPLQLLEAMALELPVLAFAIPSVEGALGDAGVRFSQKHFALLAELCHELSVPGTLRDRVLEGQQQRLDELTRAADWRELFELPEPKFHTRRARAKPRVALVVQRYGEQISGGAERHARMVAQQLAPHADVTVLATCAADHFTWANALPEGEDQDGDVRVLRFPTLRQRSMRPFNAYSRQLFGRGVTRVEEERWSLEQGPHAPALREYLLQHREDYDAFLFFTYLYSTTAELLPLVRDRALLVPTAHDEPPLAFELYRDVFEAPQALLCNTPEEIELIERRFPNHARARVVGVGVDTPAVKPERFAQEFGVDRSYLLYVGRLEAGKGLPEALKLHQRLCESFHDAPDFLIAGAGELSVRGARVRALGRIGEQEKFDALAGALAVVVPSRYESLSLLALEAFSVGTPVIANEASEVLRGQIARSSGGYTYRDFESFAEAVRRAREERLDLSRQAKAFAKKHRWSVVVDAYLDEIEQVAKERR